jgi:hypothetical protein
LIKFGLVVVIWPELIVSENWRKVEQGIPSHVSGMRLEGGQFQVQTFKSASLVCFCRISSFASGVSED